MNQSEQVFHLLGSIWKEQVPQEAIESRPTCPIPRADRATGPECGGWVLRSDERALDRALHRDWLPPGVISWYSSAGKGQVTLPNKISGSL